MRNKLILLLFAIGFVQCREVVEDMGECPNIQLPQLSYSLHVYPIVSRTCAIPQCHTTDFDYGNFNRFDELKKRADNGKLRFMIETHQMPHGFTNGPQQLTTCEIETIKKWIRDGANNN